MMTPAPSGPEPDVSLAFAVVASSTAPLLLLDGDLVILAASASFCSAFHLIPAGVSGRPLADLGAGEWKVPQLDVLLRATALGLADVDAYEMDLKRGGEETRRLVVNARRLEYTAANDSVRLLVAISDVTVARLAETLKADLLREKAFLLQELQHRVANSLQIIASVLMQSARRVQSEETRLHLYDAHQRVMSVAAMQQHLSTSRLGDVHLRSYFTDLCRSIGASMIRDPAQLSLDVVADDSVSTADISMSLGLIVTELVINALKHAFPDRRSGRITVDYHSRGADWTLSVSDNGVGMAAGAKPAKSGLGTSLIEALARQLLAHIDVADARPGTTVSIVHMQAEAAYLRLVVPVQAV